MFAILCKDGSSIVEFKDVQCWDEVPSDIEIQSISLHAGGGLGRTISGYEMYAVDYEKTLTAPMTICDSIVTKMPQALKKPRLIAQRLLAVRSLSAWRGKNQAEHYRLNREIGTMANQDGCSEFMKRILAKAQSELGKNLDEAIVHLNNTELIIYRLGFSGEKHSFSEKDFNMNIFREGIVGPSVIPNEEEIRKQLYPR